MRYCQYIAAVVRRRIILSILPIVLLLFMSGCLETEEYTNDPYGNFDALAEIIDTRYCFFEEKGVDWEEVTQRYRARLSDDMSILELFNLLSEMLDELRDGHVNLSSKFNTSRYMNWWSDYPADFDYRTLREYYLDFDYMTTSGMIYKVLDGNIGYIYYPSFSTTVSPLALDYVLAYLHECDGIILDIRDNGGGLLTNIDTLVGRFITAEVPGGSITHKNGPGHDDFSEPYSFSYKPADPSRHITYTGPIALLINHGCYSAANAFAAVMRTLPQVTLMGATTGGGAGLPASYELPNGWLIRLSASPLYDPTGQLTEFGVAPSPGYECHASDEELARGVDAILDRAIVYLRSSAESAKVMQ